MLSNLLRYMIWAQAVCVVLGALPAFFGRIFRK
jgi:hypothetical protein